MSDVNVKAIPLALEAIFERPIVTHIRAKPCCIYCGAPDVDGLFNVVADRWSGTEVVVCDECLRAD